MPPRIRRTTGGRLDGVTRLVRLRPTAHRPLQAGESVRSTHLEELEPHPRNAVAAPLQCPHEHRALEPGVATVPYLEAGDGPRVPLRSAGLAARKARVRDRDQGTVVSPECVE